MSRLLQGTGVCVRHGSEGQNEKLIHSPRRVSTSFLTKNSFCVQASTPHPSQRSPRSNLIHIWDVPTLCRSGGDENGGRNSLAHCPIRMGQCASCKLLVFRITSPRMDVNPGPSRRYGRPTGRAEAHGTPKSTGKPGGQTHVKRHLVQSQHPFATHMKSTHELVGSTC